MPGGSPRPVLEWASKNVRTPVAPSTKTILVVLRNFAFSFLAGAGHRSTHTNFCDDATAPTARLLFNYAENVRRKRRRVFSDQTTNQRTAQHNRCSKRKESITQQEQEKCPRFSEPANISPQLIPMGPGPGPIGEFELGLFLEQFLFFAHLRIALFRESTATASPAHQHLPKACFSKMSWTGLCFSALHFRMTSSRTCWNRGAGSLSGWKKAQDDF